MNKILPCLVCACALHAVPAAASAEDGVSADRILIGQTVGLTGQVAGTVREMNEGARAYFAEVNRNGGVHGRRIEVMTLDDKFDPAAARANAERLVRYEHVFALFQTRGTPHTEAVLPVLARAGVPLVAPSTGAAMLHEPVNRLLFNVRASYRTEVSAAVAHFATVNLRRIGLVYVDDSFGADVLAGFQAALAHQRLEPAFISRFDRTAPDVSAVVAAAMAARPDALILAGSAATTAELIKRLRKEKAAIQLMTLSNNSSRAFVNALGPDGAGVIVSQVTPAPNLVTTELGSEFQQAARSAGTPVSYAAMEGFIAAKVLVEGLRRAGRDLNRERFMRALESMHKVDLGGLLLDYGERNRTGTQYVELTMIAKDGRFLR